MGTHALFEVVYSNPRFWTAAYLWHEEHANTFIGRLPITHFNGNVQLNSIKTFARVGAYQLPWGNGRFNRVPAPKFAKVLSPRLSLQKFWIMKN